MNCKDAYSSIIQGILDGNMRHSVLNNTVYKHKINYAEAEEFYNLTMKLIHKVRSEAMRES